MAADRARNNISLARNLGVLNPNTLTSRDLVSSTDRDDLYRFSVSGTRSSTDISLSGLRRGTNADIEVFSLKPGALRRIGRIDFSRLTAAQRRQNLTSVARSARGTGLSEAINLNLAGGQQYYLRVQFRRGRTVSYNLGAFANLDNAGEDLLSARSIEAGQLYNDYVGLSDSSDFYKFNIADFKTTTISLNGLGADANLRLLNASGAQIAASANGGTTPETITTDLSRGDYYLEVTPVAGAATTYTVGISTSSLADNGGNTPETATPITVDFNSRFLNDVINDGDLNDYYSFDLAGDSVFDLKLTGLQADANVELINALDGSTVSSSVNSGTSDESISITPIDPTSANPFPLLTAGSYYIRVFQGSSGQNTPYQLEYSAVPGVDRAGNTPGLARDITTNLTGTSITNPALFNDFVGGVDNNDYYTFVVPAGGNFLSVKLTIAAGTNVNADVELLQDTGGGTQAIIASSTKAGNATEAFGGNLAAGTYYLRVYPAASDQGTFYDLSMYARPTNGIPSIARDINPGEGSSNPNNLTVVGNNKVFFLATNENNATSLWQADGSVDPTDIGTLQGIKPVTINTSLSNISNLVSGESQGADVLYFTANVGADLQLWKTDGTTSQSVLSLTTIGATVLTGLVPVGDLLYVSVFNENNPSQPNTLLRTDGTVGGEVIIEAPIGVGSFSSVISQLTASEDGSTLYFSADTANTGRELWKVSGSATTAVLINVAPDNPLDPDGIASSSPSNLFNFDGDLYFTAAANNEGNEIWKYTGTGSPTQVTTLLPGDIEPFGNDVEPNFAIFNDELYFTANGISSSQQTGKELWKINSSGSQELVFNINTTSIGASSDPVELTVVSQGGVETLYFVASNGVNGRELLRYTGSGVPQTLDINGTGIDSGVTELTDVAGILYFRADDGVNGSELWKVESSTATPELVDIDTSGGIAPGGNSSTPSELTEVLGRLFFVASNGTASTDPIGNGAELWIVG